MTTLTEVQGILQELQHRGWSISAIGRGIGTHYTTIERWIKGSTQPENTTAVAMALRQLLQQPVPKRPYRKAKAA